MLIGEKIRSFVVKNIRFCKEASASAVELVHEKTGAQVFWLDNGEVNKLFAIAFTTLPADDSGVFHIIEHSVLCGSEKYPVKEPFVELLKSSMQTFQNAMTYPDKTVYPVSSRNEQDYLNLVSVYLDAVFAPRMTHQENVFLQEGWHLEENEGQLNCKGVVYNEMKGAMSEEGSLISRKLSSLLYPDNSYGFNSGGSPAAIRRLSYEQFIETYQRAYHPSNARVYLDGAVPIEETLKMLAEYFDRYEPLAELPAITPQPPVFKEAVQYYDFPQGEDSANKGRLTLGRIIGRWDERVKKNAARLVGRLLTDTNEAPLKKAVLDKGLAGNITVTVQTATFQPYVNIHLKDLKDGAKDEAMTCVRDTVEAVLSRGLSREDLEAQIDQMEFSLREQEEPQALYRCIQALSGWLYGGDPLAYLCYDELLAQLRSLLDTDYYDRLAREIFLAQGHGAVLLTLPSQTLAEEIRREEAADLAALWETLRDEDKAALRLRNRALTAWQQTPDSPESLAALPLLPLSAVNADLEWVDTLETEAEGVRVWYHPVNSPGIVYFTARFNLADCALQELTQLSMLPMLLGKLPTRRYDVPQLARQIKKCLGAFSVSLTEYAPRREMEVCTPCLEVKGSALAHRLGDALDLTAEILLHTRFDSHDKIRRIVKQACINARQVGVAAGHAVGIRQTGSRYSAAAAVGEAVSGGTGLRWLKNFNENFEADIAAFESLALRVQRQNFCQRRMQLSVTAGQMPETAAFIAQFPQGTETVGAAAYALRLPHRAGIPVPAQISYAVQGYRLGRDYRGSDSVIANLLSLDYYWNEVRVQGGAYGAGFGVDLTGSMFTYTYRDPSPAASLNVNLKAGEYLRKLAKNKVDLSKYIISTAAENDPLRSPREKGEWADQCRLRGIAREEALKWHRELLNTDLRDLSAFADEMDAFAREGAVCVVGDAAKLPPDFERMEL